VVPSLAEALKFRPLKILCAGCSSGEEAYSAVIALQNAGLELNRVRWEIDAHDINPERIARAEEAVYEESSVRNCSEEVRRRYFRPVNGHYRLRDRHRKGVRFFVTNLLAQGTWFAAEIYDVVLCRNMLIYLGEPAIYQLIGRFERLLRPGGYLLLGHAESLMDRDTSFQPVSVSGGIIYRKPSEG
jgi:chemotaxis protein methyltransferase CheR